MPFIQLAPRKHLQPREKQKS